MPEMGGGFSFGNLFKGGGTPNNAAVAAEAGKNINQPGNSQKLGADGKPVPTHVPGTGMPNEPGNPGADPSTTVKGDATLGAADPKGQGSPLDAFADIFKIDPNASPAVDPLSQKLLELDPKKFGETVSKMDFTRNLNPELVQKALQGDIQAFSSVLNSAFQGAFAASMQMTVGVMEQAFSKNNGRFNSVLEGKFKNFQINSAAPQNKALNHPAAKPVLAALRQQIANSSVGQNLSPQEINQRAEEYFIAMGTALGSLRGEGDLQGGDKGGPKEMDWSMFEATPQQ